jgi:hypothetical protein
MSPSLSLRISHASFFSPEDPAFYLNTMECEKKTFTALKKAFTEGTVYMYSM